LRHRSLVVALVFSAAGAVAAQEPPAKRDVPGELACGAQSPLVAPMSAMRVLGGQDAKKTLFAPGDAVIVGAGTAQGLKPGQEYFVRRLIADRFTQPLPNFFPVSVHTAGWLKIVDAEADVSIATVTRACADGIMPGDYLESFEMPKEPPATMTAGEPDFARPGHLILADDRRQLGGAGVLMVLDRGSDHGIKPGQRMTIFRYTLKGAGPVHKIGTATAMVIRPETTLIRIDDANSEVYVGDLVAIHR
jgi:hypothetical protein